MKIILLLLAFMATARADGFSYLGMCNKTWNCERTLKQWKGEPFGWLENSFGDSCICADRMLATHRRKVIRIHLLNGPCMRNRRCGRHEAFYGYTARSASRAIMRGRGRVFDRFLAILERTKERLSKANGKVTCYISPCLECDLYDRARRRLADIVSVHLPNCNIVDNPNSYSCLRDTVCERHGENPDISVPCIVDLDGHDAAEVDIKKWVAKYQSCDLRFIWYPWMNCVGSKFVDPIKRKCT